MQFTREINRLLAGILVLFGITTLAAAYWAIAGADTVLRREDNPRLVEAEASILRGQIVDRNGEPLAVSTAGENGVVRRYLHPETNGALGYFSLRYGVGGAEAAYDTVLRGDNIERGFADALSGSLLHRPQQGSDIMLTLDLDIQQAVVGAMRSQTGAVVVLSVPDGEVLAMASLPTYDPNQLDAQWDTLSASEGKPFFNRVLQGRYQPGGTLETALMAAALLSNVPLDERIPGATAPVEVNDVTLTCAVRLPDIPLTLRESYAFACPSAFVELGESLGASAVIATLDTFKLYQPPVLPGFVAADEATPPTLALGQEDLSASAVGQGRLTVSPLAMATLAAAIVNDGNAPQPHALVATRSPGSAVWRAEQSVRPTMPVATVATARQLQDLMRDAVANGAAQNAGRPNVDIGGHATLSYSGESSLAWFVGFATLGGRQGVAVAVVLENSDDPGLAADIGGRALEAAHAALQTDV